MSQDKFYEVHNRQTSKNGKFLQNSVGAQRHFKDYIIREEPTEETGIISINGVYVLSIGNVLLLTGPMKGGKRCWLQSCQSMQT